MKRKRNIKETIVKEAFKLFLSRPYEKVTYTDIEEATGFSRGAILYYFSFKQDILEEVVNQYLFQDNSIFDFYNKQIGMSFLSFIHIYCDWIENKKKHFKEELGIDNYNFALANFTLQVLHYMPSMKEQYLSFNEMEKRAWRDILNVAIEAGELRRDTDVDLFASMFQTFYYGTSYLGMTLPFGADTSLLRGQLLRVYEAIKV